MDGLVMGGGDYPCGFMVGDSGRDGFSWRSMEFRVFSYNRVE